MAAQMAAYCADDLWLRLARHANAMADRLASALAALGIKPVWPVEANEIFVALPQAMDARLKAAGAIYHPWITGSLPRALVLASDTSLVRLVTSFATTAQDVDRFAAIAAGGE
jgi:threonine aldolase